MKHVKEVVGFVLQKRQVKVGGWFRGNSPEKVIAMAQERNDKGWDKSRKGTFGNLIITIIL